MTITSFDGLIVSIFAYDIKIMALKRSGMIKQMKTKLASTFLIADIEPISFYLSLKVEWNWKKKIMKLFQPAYINKIFAKFYLNKAHFINTLMKENAFLLQKTNREASAFEKK